MKMVNLDKHPDAAVSVKKEVCIQKILQNPHILRYYGKRSQGSIEYIFLEYAAGGELFDRIGEFIFDAVLISKKSSNKRRIVHKLSMVQEVYRMKNSLN